MSEQDWAAAEAALALFNAPRPSLSPDELYAKEGDALRFMLVNRRLGGPRISFDEYVELSRTAWPSAHVCAPTRCRYAHLSTGASYEDLDTRAMRTASGLVYVCREGGAMHVCDDIHCRDHLPSTIDMGTLYCPVSGIFKGAILNNSASFDQADYYQMTTQSSGSMRRERRTGMIGGGSGMAPAPRVKRSAAASAAAAKRHAPPPDVYTTIAQPAARNYQRDAETLSDRLIVEGLIRDALVAKYEQADEQALAEAEQYAQRQGGAPDVVDIASIVGSHLLPGLTDAAVVTNWHFVASAAAHTQDMLYLKAAVLKVFQIVRETPECASSNKDVNMLKMYFAIVYSLRDGIVGAIDVDRTTGELDERRVHTELRAEEDEDDETTVVRRHVFVPAHPGLANVFPPIRSLPAIAAVADPMKSIMRRRRRVANCFLSVLGASHLRPQDFCLATYLAPIRRDIFTAIPSLNATSHSAPSSHR